MQSSARTLTFFAVVLVTGLASAIVPANGAEVAEAISPPSASVSREAIRDIAYHPTPVAGPVPSAPVTAQKSGESDVVHLSPYIVKELPPRTVDELDRAIDQRIRLDSGSYIKRKVGPTARLEMVFPPELEIAYLPEHHDPIPRLRIKFISLSW